MAHSSPPTSLFDDEAIMLGEPRQRDLKDDFPGALWPAILFLRLFEPFELAANIDKHTGDFRTHGSKCPHDPVFGCENLVP